MVRSARRMLLGDVLPAALVLAAALLPVDPRHPHPAPLALTVPVLAVAAGAVLLRRRAPVAALWVCVALVPVVLLLATPLPALELPVAVAAFAVGRLRPTRTVVGNAVPVAVLLAIGAGVAFAGGSWSLAQLVQPVILQPVVVVGFAAALGSAVRINRQAVEAATERAERAEASREAEARRRVAEDRLAIARDLHDSVAHRIAVINLHAGVAARSIRQRPDDAERSVAVIGEAARQVIAEIQDLLVVLRSGAEKSPEPSSDRIDGLLAVFARGGLQVTEHRTGALDPHGPAGAVVYRVVQEGLTNVVKHGAGSRADLRLAVDDGVARVELTNPVGPGGGPAVGGHGLVGMRERVEALGGALSTGTSGDRFTLVATVPLAAAPAAAREGAR